MMFSEYFNRYMNTLTMNKYSNQQEICNLPLVSYLCKCHQTSWKTSFITIRCDLFILIDLTETMRSHYDEVTLLMTWILTLLITFIGVSFFFFITTIVCSISLSPKKLHILKKKEKVFLIEKHFLLQHLWIHYSIDWFSYVLRKRTEGNRSDQHDENSQLRISIILLLHIRRNRKKAVSLIKRKDRDYRI